MFMKENIDNSSMRKLNRSQKKILTLLWSLPAITFAFLLLSIRIPVREHTFLITKTFLFMVSFVSLVNFVYMRVTTIGFAISMGLLFVALTGMIPSPGYYSFWVVSLLTFLFQWRIVKVLIKRNLKTFIISFLIIFFATLPFYNLVYSQIDTIPRLVSSTLINDTLFHSAIAAIWKNYSVISHGLHGLGELNYHFGSHIFMASVSILINVPSLQSYSHFFGFFMVPLLGIVSISIAEEFLPSKTIKDFFSKLIAYGFILLGTGIFVKGSFLYNFGIWPSFYESESYTFSLILLLCLLSTLKMETSYKLFYSLLIISSFSFLFVAKISTGASGLALIGSWALLSNRKIFSREFFFRWIVFLVCFLLSIFLFPLIHKRMEGESIVLFDFLNTIPMEASVWIKYPIFVLVHFIFFILACIFYALNGKIFFLRDAFPVWWMFGTILSALLGLFIVTFLKIDGGAGYYFSNISMFMVIPFILCIFQLKFNRNEALTKILIVIIILSGLFYAPRVLFSGLKNYMLQISRYPLGSSLSIYVKKLENIRDDKKTINSLVYIPRSEVNFWGHKTTCVNLHHAISAISERPAIYGWPRGDKDCYWFLCSNRYHSNGLCEKSQLNFSDQELMEEAIKLGFSQVIIVKELETRVINRFPF